LIGNISLSKNIIEKSPASWLDYARSEKIDSTFYNAPISYSPNYVGSIGVNYRIGFWKRTINEERTISISKSSLSFRIITKIVGQQYLDNTGDESRKLDQYNFSEFMINYNHVLKINKSSINFKLQINNLFNQYYANNGYTWGYMYGSRNVIQEVYLFPSANRNMTISAGITF
jgi:iron complex outermembrane receptor protein